MRHETTHALKLRLEVSKGKLSVENLRQKRVYGPMKNKQVKDDSVEESWLLGQTVSLGQLSSHSRVTTDRQSAPWSAWALGRGRRSKNQRHSPIGLGSWKSLWKRCGGM